MTHEGLADFLHDAGFHEPGVERVPKVMETDVADARAADGGLPCGLDCPHGMTFEGEDQAFRLWAKSEKIEQPVCERNLSRLAAGGLGTGYGKEPAIEIHVLPSLVEDFTASHAGVERCDNDLSKVR